MSFLYNSYHYIILTFISQYICIYITRDILYVLVKINAQIKNICGFILYKIYINSILNEKICKTVVNNIITA